MKSAIEYLRRKEWSAGNGQCFACWGVNRSWIGHSLHRDPRSVGHEPSCPLALALADLGEDVLFKYQVFAK